MLDDVPNPFPQAPSTQVTLPSSRGSGGSAGEAYIMSVGPNLNLRKTAGTKAPANAEVDLQAPAISLNSLLGELASYVPDIAALVAARAMDLSRGLPKSTNVTKSKGKSKPMTPSATLTTAR